MGLAPPYTQRLFSFRHQSFLCGTCAHCLMSFRCVSLPHNPHPGSGKLNFGLLKPTLPQAAGCLLSFQPQGPMSQRGWCPGTGTLP